MAASKVFVIIDKDNKAYVFPKKDKALRDLLSKLTADGMEPNIYMAKSLIVDTTTVTRVTLGPCSRRGSKSTSEVVSEQTADLATEQA